MLAAIATLLATAQAAAPPPPAPVKLWRLDCGSLAVSDFAAFSDAHRYDGQKRTLVDSCYLIRHGADYLLWDAGLATATNGRTVDVFTLHLPHPIVAQLAQLGIKPSDVRYVAVSHNHFDHIGQLPDFARSTLLIGAADLAAIKARPALDETGALKPWTAGAAKADPVDGDRDVFGDGSVVMLALPGHTPGHHALLVRLPNAGAMLLSGDLYHAAESMAHGEVPTFNASRVDTLSSFDRFAKLATNLKATVVIGHEPADVAKLPAFPAAAE